MNDGENAPVTQEQTALAINKKSPAEMNFEETWRLGKAIVQSQLFPHIDTESKAFALMMICQSEGLHPMAAVRRYDIILGRPALKTGSMLADYKKIGGKYNVIQKTDKICEIDFDIDGSKYNSVWTIEDAKKAGLLDKKGGMWLKYPRQMLFARAASEGVRTIAPEVLQGINIVEEVMDFDDVPSTPAGLNVQNEIAVVDEGTKKRNKKIRNGINPQLVKCKTMVELEQKISAWKDDYPDYEGYFTYQKDGETFASLFDQHREGVKKRGDVEETETPGYQEEFDSIYDACNSSEKFHDLEVFLDDNKALQTEENFDKMNELGKLYGDKSYRQ